VVVVVVVAGTVSYFGIISSSRPSTYRQDTLTRKQLLHVTLAEKRKTMAVVLMAIILNLLTAVTADGQSYSGNYRLSFCLLFFYSSLVIDGVRTSSSPR
jgi:hypothetical protein